MLKIQIICVLSLISSGCCQGGGNSSAAPVWMSSFISGTGIPIPGPREDPSGWCTLTKHYVETFLQVTLFQRERLPNSAPGRLDTDRCLFEIIKDLFQWKSVISVFMLE